MSSADYWKKREQEAKKETIRDEEEYRKRIETIYKQTYEAVERQINDWYARYASKNGLSMSEARMRVKKLDMERYERLAAKYVATHDFSDQANEEMEIYNLTMRINRLELLKAQINLELLAGYDDLDKELEREFIEQAMKEDRRLAGILGDSVIGNQRYAKQIVNASFWNATYSERIWGNNMPRLRSSIETQLRNGIIQGIHSTELARNLRKSFDVSIRDSERLMITEVRRIQTEIQKDSFDRNGFKEYRFISAGDGKVCPECERLHGQHFKVSEMQPGENAPPMHPVCRCSTAAWMDGEKYKRWLDALERGEDVRWKDFDEWEKQNKQKDADQDKDLITAWRKLAKKTENKDSMSERARNIATSKSVGKQMRDIEILLDDYISNPSQWSGKVMIDDKMPCPGRHNRRTHNITVRTDTTLKTKFHELIHARTKYRNRQPATSDLQKYHLLNEAITELAAQEICANEGIDVLNPSYTQGVQNLRKIAQIMSIKDLKFGVTLVDIQFEDRYDWIEKKLNSMKTNGTISSKDHGTAIAYLQKLV